LARARGPAWRTNNPFSRIIWIFQRAFNRIQRRARLRIALNRSRRESISRHIEDTRDESAIRYASSARLALLNEFPDEQHPSCPGLTFNPAWTGKAESSFRAFRPSSSSFILPLSERGTAREPGNPPSNDAGGLYGHLNIFFRFSAFSAFQTARPH